MSVKESFIVAHCFRDCCNFRRHDPNDESVNILRYFQYVGAKFLLEVCGASGAIWGSTQVFMLRETEFANEVIRLIALVVGLIFSIRFWWIAKHYYQHDHEFPSIKEKHRRSHFLPFFQVYSSKFILEVLGGTGAIWGCSEALYLRNSTNEFGWRVASCVVGTIFLIRCFFQIFAYCLCFMSLWSNPTTFLMKASRWYDALISKLILEVFGAAGAVWGFSEIIHFRNPNTTQYWHPVAIAIFIIFLARWTSYLSSFYKEERKSVEVPTQVGPEETRPEEVKDLEVNDLAMIETSSSDDIIEAVTFSPSDSGEPNTKQDDVVENGEIKILPSFG